jgi:hypothetical protein
VSRSNRSRPARKRIGRFTCYHHHGAWHIDSSEGERQVRWRVAETESVAARVNAQPHAAAPTILAFTSVTVPELRHRFLDHHGSEEPRGVARRDHDLDPGTRLAG